MSDLKFSCPSCAQHIQCDESYAGERIPCPSCASVVRVPTDAPIAVKPAPPTAPATTATVGGGVPDVPTLDENILEESGTPLPTSPPLTEREQQIAAARAAHPVLPMSTVKPRLSYILSGGQAPPPAENESATHVEHKPEEGSSSDQTDSFHE
jgi:hypothetical protein